MLILVALKICLDEQSFQYCTDILIVMFWFFFFKAVTNQPLKFLYSPFPLSMSMPHCVSFLMRLHVRVNMAGRWMLSEAFPSHLVVMGASSINLYAFWGKTDLLLCIPVQREISVYEALVALRWMCSCPHDARWIGMNAINLCIYIYIYIYAYRCIDGIYVVSHTCISCNVNKCVSWKKD